MIDSQEHERQRIAGELHDRLGQQLLVIRNRAMLGERCADGSGASRSQFDEIASSATQAIDEVRHDRLQPAPDHLDRLGLAASIEEMVETVASATGIQFSADIEPLDGLLSKDDEINCYRIIQESAQQHRQACGRRRRPTSRSGARMASCVSPCATTDMAWTPRREASGSGRRTRADEHRRAVRMLGGTLTIDPAPGEGTTINIQIAALGAPRSDNHDGK